LKDSSFRSALEMIRQNTPGEQTTRLRAYNDGVPENL